MHLLQSIYPVAVASLNIALGWLFYRPFESVFGIPLVVIGLLVILTQVGGTVREHRPVLGKSA